MSLLTLLDNLRQGSSASVQNGESLDEFEKQMHICRPVENVLFEMMKKIHDNGHGLILVIGNSGDGKSHMFSTIKGNIGGAFDPTIVNDFVFYNDASESCSPRAGFDSMKTLGYALADFSMIGRSSELATKMVMAMNLGKAQEFMYNEEFQEDELFPNIISALQEAIPALGAPLREDQVKPHDDILVLDFSSFQMFRIEPNQINTDDGNICSVPFSSDFIDSLLLKVGNNNRYENPFYKEYYSEKGGQYAYIKSYLFLTNPNIRKAIASLIIEAIVKFRLVVSPRELMGFIYSVVVGHGQSAMRKVSELLPNLIFDGGENRIVAALCKLDPLKSSDKEINAWLSEYMTCDVVPEELANMGDNLLRNSGIENVLNALYQNGDEDMVAAARFLVRYRYLMEYKTLDLTYVRYSNLMSKCKCKAQDPQILRDYSILYNMVEKAVLNSRGISLSDTTLRIPLSYQSENYKFVSDISISKDLKKSRERATFDLNRDSCFDPFISLYWKIGGTDEISLDVDFQLYLYIKSLVDGRLFNASDIDKNLFFNNFVDQLSEKSLSNSIVRVVSGGTTVITIRQESGYIDVQ